MLGKILALVLGAVLGAALLGVTLGLVGSALAVSGMALTLLVRRDWVPPVYNLRSLTVRKVTSTLTGLGLALVVFVFTSVLMLADGINKTLVATGAPDNVKVLRKGSHNEVQSGVTPDLARLLEAAPEIAVGADGKPVASSELTVLIFAQKEGAASEFEGSNLTVRGVGPAAFELHRGVQIDGRRAQPGTSEIMIGKALVGRYQGMRAGGQVRFARRDWTVVGVIDSHGSAYDSEVWGDVDQFMDAFQRRGAVSSVTLRLRDPASFKAFKARLAADPQLATLETQREVDYFAAQSETFATFIRALGLSVALIFAFGAILGAMITMYAQVAARTREIGTLRALGFRRRAILVSFVLESILLSLVAGGVGVAAASGMQAVSFSTMNFQTFSELSFGFHLTGRIVASSLFFAATMGYAGGLLPAMRAARMPITQATRGG
jgi:ABC-type lipoprotein release transport system permease subunit